MAWLFELPWLTIAGIYVAIGVAVALYFVIKEWKDISFFSCLDALGVVIFFWGLVALYLLIVLVGMGCERIAWHFEDFFEWSLRCRTRMHDFFQDCLARVRAFLARLRERWDRLFSKQKAE